MARGANDILIGQAGVDVLTGGFGGHLGCEASEIADHSAEKSDIFEYAERHEVDGDAGCEQQARRVDLSGWRDMGLQYQAGLVCWAPLGPSLN